MRRRIARPLHSPTMGPHLGGALRYVVSARRGGGRRRTRKAGLVGGEAQRAAGRVANQRLAQAAHQLHVRQVRVACVSFLACCLTLQKLALPTDSAAWKGLILGMHPAADTCQKGKHLSANVSHQFRNVVPDAEILPAVGCTVCATNA